MLLSGGGGDDTYNLFSLSLRATSRTVLSGLPRSARTMLRRGSALLPQHSSIGWRLTKALRHRSWMRHELRPLMDDLLSDASLGQRGLFDPAAVRRLREADALGRADGTYTLFAMLCMEIWCRLFLDGAGSRMARA